jgi:hypothetical protein
MGLLKVIAFQLFLWYNNPSFNKEHNTSFRTHLKSLSHLVAPSSGVVVLPIIPRTILERCLYYAKKMQNEVMSLNVGNKRRHCQALKREESAAHLLCQVCVVLVSVLRQLLVP